MENAHSISCLPYKDAGNTTNKNTNKKKLFNMKTTEKIIPAYDLISNKRR
jgi:hypothetical protein